MVALMEINSSHDSELLNTFDSLNCSSHTSNAFEVVNEKWEPRKLFKNTNRSIIQS